MLAAPGGLSSSAATPLDLAASRATRASGRDAMTTAAIKSPLSQLAHRDGGIAHAIGETPLVVVPGHHAHEGAVDHLGLQQVEGRAGGVVVEVHRHQRLVVDGKDALERTVGGL